MSKQIVFVATVETYYGVIAVADTEAEAKRLVALQAIKYLRKAGVDVSDRNTPAKLDEAMGITVTRVPVGTACYVNNELN